MTLNFQQTIVAMLLAHLVADYTLQGILANLKQVSWWRKQTQEKKYRHDYIAGLACHSLYWSILVCLPFWESSHFLAAVIANAAIHGYIDDAKANRFEINLIEDQLLHLLQIVITIFIFR